MQVISCIHFGVRDEPTQSCALQPFHTPLVRLAVLRTFARTFPQSREEGLEIGARLIYPPRTAYGAIAIWRLQRRVGLINYLPGFDLSD